MLAMPDYNNNRSLKVIREATSQLIIIKLFEKKKPDRFNTVSRLANGYSHFNFTFARSAPRGRYKIELQFSLFYSMFPSEKR